jgi:hypothetical protein
VSGVCRTAGEIHCPARVAGLRSSRTERRVLYLNRLVVLWGMDCVPPHTHTLAHATRVTTVPHNQITVIIAHLPAQSNPQRLVHVISVTLQCCNLPTEAQCSMHTSALFRVLRCVDGCQRSHNSLSHEQDKSAVVMATSASSNREAVWFARHLHLHSHTHSHTSPTR